MHAYALLLGRLAPDDVFARRLEKQIGKYNEELRDASVKVNGDAVGATQEQALSEFIHQVQQQLRRLQDKIDEKKAELAALREGEGEEDVETEAADLP